MNALRYRIRRDESGASLVLAIVFMVVAGAIGASLTTSVASGLNGSEVLTTMRNREYSADGAIQSQIAKIRALPMPGVNDPDCPSPYTGVNALNGIDITVNCADTPAVAADPTTGTVTTQHNVSFLACLTSVSQCTAATAIITALVNFQGSGASGTTYVEAWSVNG